MTLVRVGRGLTATRLHVERSGAGAPLLWITGFAISSEIFAPVIDDYAAEFDCIRYDSRGAGRSDVPWKPTSIPELAADAVRLLDALGLDSAHVYGLSMGGMVAQELVLRRPDHVRTLTLVGTTAGGPSALRTYPPVVQALAGPLLRGAGVPEALVGMVVSRARQLGVAPDEATLRTILTQLAAIGGHDTLERLRDLAVPTLVLHGERDPAVPVANARILADAIPGARLEVLTGAGHVVFWQQPERCAQLVADFALGAQVADGPPAPRS